jgi:hypothetical protein
MNEIVGGGRTCFTEQHFDKLDDRTTGTKAQKYSLLNQKRKMIFAQPPGGRNVGGHLKDFIS